MNLELIGNLIRLRYKLLWANTRTRNGKIALFFAGYLLLVMVVVLFAAGGLGAGMAAVRSGHGTPLAGGLLTGIFLQGLLASVVLGFGMTVVFSEIELRRYPLKARERLLTRHFIGIADPFWILFFALDLGLAFGLYLFGAASFWYGLLAVLLLFVCNYIGARVLASLVERLTSRRFGSMVMLGALMLLGFLPALLGPALQRNKALAAALVRLWWTTPPAAAGVAMTHADLSVLSAFGVIVLWTLALIAVLVALERWPLKTAVAQSVKVVWEGRMDRLAAVFGLRTGPLVAHWMRFYFRNSRFRTIYPLALPLTAFLLFFFTRQTRGGGPFSGGPSSGGPFSGGPFSSGPFPIVLGVFGILGFVGTGQFAVNQLGYLGGGFRRFLLLPTDPAAAFRAGSYMFVCLAGALILPGAILFAVFGPIHTGAAMLAMLVGFSLASLFLVHGVALWTSLLSPRRGKYAQSFGNDLSFAGNIVIIGGMMVFLFGPRALAAAWPAAVSPLYWWATPLLALATAAFYFASLRSASTLFRSRRERLMALLEGRG